MPNRTAAVSRIKNCSSSGGGAGDKQFVLVLIGLFVFLAQIYFSFARSYPLTAYNDGQKLSVAYHSAENGSEPSLFFTSNSINVSDMELISAPTLPAELAPLLFQPIPINIASADLLSTIPGIGRHLANEIRSYIRINGGMTELSEINKVRGIGEQKSKQILKHIRI